MDTLCSQVTFSHIPYSKAYSQGKKQDKIMKKFYKILKSMKWDSIEIENKILSMMPRSFIKS